MCPSLAGLLVCAFCPQWNGDYAGVFLQIAIPSHGVPSLRGWLGPARQSLALEAERYEVPGRFVTSVRRNVMKVLVSALALTLAVAFAGPAFAGEVTQAKNEADCTKAGGTWEPCLFRYEQ